MSEQPGLRLVAIAASAPGKVRLDGHEMPSITAALDSARAGSIIDIGRGQYGEGTETYPLRVPDEVTLRGPTPPDIPREARKHLPTPAPAALVADGVVLDIVGSDVRIEHLDLTTTRPGTAPAVEIGPGGRVSLESCAVSGGVQLSGTRDSEVRWTTIAHGRLIGSGVTGLHIVGGAVTGTHGTGALVEFIRSSDVRIEALAATDGESGIVLSGCDEVLIGGCAVLGDDIGVHGEHSRHVNVSGNRLRARRAVHLVDCVDGEITANGVERADIAFTLEDCTSITVGANHVREARVEVESTSG